jgi:hypothetical protein
LKDVVDARPVDIPAQSAPEPAAVIPDVVIVPHSQAFIAAGAERIAQLITDYTQIDMPEERVEFDFAIMGVQHF